MSKKNKSDEVTNTRMITPDPEEVPPGPKPIPTPTGDRTVKPKGKPVDPTKKGPHGPASVGVDPTEGQGT